MTHSVVIPLPCCHEDSGDWVDDMERIDTYAFYKLALDLHAIHLGENTPRTADVSGGEALFALFTSEQAIDRLLAGDPVVLGVSRGAAEDFKKIISELWKDYFKDAQGKFRSPGKDDPAIPAWRWNGLRTTLQVFENVFRAEMRDATNYQIPDLGLFATPKLVNAAEQTFLPELLPFISDKTKEDFNAAGRCLAFNLLTATGFHVVRAVEGTLEIYYQTFTGKTGTLKGWDAYLKALEKVVEDGASPPPESKTINLLKQMKDDYRNPVVHPRVVLAEADARILFSNGEAAIMGMAQEIKQAKEQKEPQPAAASTAS